MLFSESTFTTSDNLSLYTLSALPENPPRAVIFVVHGYGEHIGRYTHVIEALVQQDFAVYGIDHRGHGKSEGERAYFATLTQAVDDLHGYYQQCVSKHPGLPRFLFGHSMGTLISLAFTLRYQSELAGLALSGCAVGANETVPGVVLSLGKLVKSIAPTLPLIPALAASEISTDPTTVEKYESDPLVYRGMWKVGMGIGLIESGLDIQKRASELTLPLLILHGEADKITPISGSRAIYAKASSTDKTLKTYPGMRHEIMNEREREKPLSELVNWLNAHVSDAGGGR